MNCARIRPDLFSQRAGFGARLALALTLALTHGVFTPQPSCSHRLTPEQVMARVRATDMSAHFYVAEVERSAALPRMLVVRVGPGWWDAEASLRTQVAEKWLHMWESAVTGGIVAVVDDRDRAVVNYDGNGRARLEPRPAPDDTAPGIGKEQHRKPADEQSAASGG